MYDLFKNKAIIKGVTLIGRSVSSLQNGAGVIAASTIALTVVTVTSLALYQARRAWKQTRIVQDLPRIHPEGDPVGKDAALRRRTNRIAAKWFKSQGVATSGDHPFVF